MTSADAAQSFPVARLLVGLGAFALGKKSGCRNVALTLIVNAFRSWRLRSTWSRTRTVHPVFRVLRLFPRFLVPLLSLDSVRRSAQTSHLAASCIALQKPFSMLYDVMLSELKTPHLDRAGAIAPLTFQLLCHNLCAKLTRIRGI